MNRAAQIGDRPCRTPGCMITSRPPKAAITAKKTRITGPNSQPTAPVPKRCTANRPIRIASDRGTIRCDRLGLTTLRPPIAEVTEIAGVIIPSPKNSPAPKMPSVTSRAVRPIRLRWIERGQRHDPAVTAVVGAHDEAGVLDRDLDHQRPEDQRDDPVDARDVSVRGVAVGGEDELLGVQGAGADVAEHDAERAESKHQSCRRGRRHPARRRWRRGSPRRAPCSPDRRRADRPVAELVRGLVEVALDPAGGGASERSACSRRASSLLGLLAERRFVLALDVILPLVGRIPVAAC